MTDSKVLIYDYKTLIQLNDALDYCGDSLLKLLKEVDNYLQSCLRAFEEQRNILNEQLEIAERELQEAERVLSEAENDYSACLDSQREHEDEDGHTYISPSCNCERSRVESARQHRDTCKEKRDECKRKLDAAERIISDCKYEIEQYKFSGGILRPNGGETTLEYLAKYHTDEAQAKMNKILEKVEKYLGRPLQQTEPNESLPPTKAEQFKKATEKVQAIQKSESSNVADANVSMLCSGCHRPMPICICARERIR
jgi:DNA repair exonuclease SbcCD ATPase subunit